jgi:catechol 2,3-dioxygenase
MSIAADTSLGSIRLVVADLDRAQDFYERTIGLRTIGTNGELVRLGAPGAERPIVELAGDPDARSRPPHSTGLYHLAVLVPDRPALGRALQRVAEAGWRFTGASDHLVSEALYLNDPEGNGIEIYRDRPRSEWPYENGQLQMATIPLDLEGVLGEAPDGPDEGMAPGTTLGHVHLQVADLQPAEDFYMGALDFDVTVRAYPGALFLSAGGYHHHIGMNTWESAGGSAPPPGSRGLDWFQVLLPNESELTREAERLESAGAALETRDDGVLANDPSGNRVLLSARRG